MVFVIKAEVRDPRAKTFTFTALKTMYGGKDIAPGDRVFVFASETEGGQGLVARGVVTSAEPVAKKAGIARQTPRVTVTVERTAVARRPLGRADLKRFTSWKDGPAGDGAQLQVLPAGDQQDRRNLGRNSRVPRPTLLSGDPFQEKRSDPIGSDDLYLRPPQFRVVHQRGPGQETGPTTTQS